MPKTLRNAFHDTLDAPPGSDLRFLPLDDVRSNRNQSRQAFDEAADNELADSVRQHGIMEPILVRSDPSQTGSFVIIAGERRWRAAQVAGLTTIPAIVRDDLDDKRAAIFTALENLQRKDLDPEDEARYFERLIDLTGLTERGLADSLGLNKNYVNRRLRLLRLRPDLFEALRRGELTQRAALAQISDDEAADGAEALLTERAALPEAEVFTTQDSLVSHGGTVDESASEDATDVPALYPWRTNRPIISLVRWADRTDFRTVPRRDRKVVRANIEAAQRALAEGLRLLDEQDAAESESITVNGRKGGKKTQQP